MDSLSLIAEQKIAKAMQEKDFNSLNWKNRPLPLDNDRFVPDDLKMADKVLKMSGSNR
jgi:hypothetical protein